MPVSTAAFCSQEPRKMPRIAIYRHQLFKISETFITAQAENLRGCDVVYIGRERFGAAPPGAESLALSDLPEMRSNFSRARQVLSRDPRPYLRLLDGRSPALIHAHFGVEGVYALPIAQRLKIPLVTTFHGFDATERTLPMLRSGHPTWWNYVLHRHGLARHGALFICVSEFIRRRVLALGFPESRTIVHYTGIDTSLFQQTSERSPRPTILHVARLVETKGTSDLIGAFARIAPIFPEAELQIVGEGPLEAALRAQVAALGLGSAIRFLGAQKNSEVMKLLSKAWILAFPSVTARSGQSEGLGMVLLEAAASGLPVVATWHNGIPEVVVDGVTGFLCSEHDVDALSHRLSELLRSENLRGEMGDAARRRAQQHFDLMRQSAALTETYNDVLNRFHKTQS